MTREEHLKKIKEYYNTGPLYKEVAKLIDIPLGGEDDLLLAAHDIANEYVLRTLKHIYLVIGAGEEIKKVMEENGYNTDGFDRRLEHHDRDKLSDGLAPVYAAVTIYRYNPDFKHRFSLKHGVGRRFDKEAWPAHYRNNDHHVGEHFGSLEYGCWIVREDNHPLQIAEMVADWIAMGVEIGNSAKLWWEKLQSIKKYSFQKKDTELIELLIRHEDRIVKKVKEEEKLNEYLEEN